MNEAARRHRRCVTISHICSGPILPRARQQGGVQVGNVERAQGTPADTSGSTGSTRFCVSPSGAWRPWLKPGI